MSSITLAFSSDRAGSADRADRAGSKRTRPTDVGRVLLDPPGGVVGRVLSDPPVALAELPAGARGVVVDVNASDGGRSDRLMALGVTPGARIVVLQTFPGVVFLCDQTELAVERSVARSVLVRAEERQS